MFTNMYWLKSLLSRIMRKVVISTCHIACTRLLTTFKTVRNPKKIASQSFLTVRHLAFYTLNILLIVCIFSLS